MLKLFLLFITVIYFSCGYTMENEHAFVFLAYIPDSYQCSIASQDLKRGIYVDELTIDFSLSNSYTKKRLYYMPTSDSTYTREIHNQMIFAWGNYNETFSLASLNFLSMYHPDQIYQIHSNDIRGVAAKNNSLLFFTNREPPKLFSYNFNDKRVVAAEIGEYSTNAENVGVKITESGSVFLRGTGLENIQLPFRIPENFIKKYSINCNVVWTLFSNRKNHIVIFAIEDNKKNIIIGNHSPNQWHYFSIDSQYIDTKLFDNYLVFQTLSGIESGRCIYIYNIDTNEHLQLVLPPFSRVVYFSSQYIIIAQPYRLLIAELNDGKFSPIHSIDFETAWYIKMVLHRKIK